MFHPNKLNPSLSSLEEIWHPTRNEIPYKGASYGSNKIYWWFSEVCHHEWQASVKNNRGYCPYCSNKRILVGFNDLATTNPTIAEEFHPNLNNNLTAENFVRGSSKKVWWLCKEGHEWQTSIEKRTGSGNTGCPVCAGKKVLSGYNDLCTWDPTIAKEFHPTLNRGLQPQKISPQSNKKVWWKCEKGHSYEMFVYARTRPNIGCPICSGNKILSGFNDLSTLFPSISAEFHPNFNGNLSPEQISPGSHKKVWWLGKECQHVWEAAINKRTSYKRGCPICVNKKVLPGFNDLATTHSLTSLEWHPTLNDKTIYEVTAGSDYRAWWQCINNREHVWNSIVEVRTRKNPSGCPQCSAARNVSLAEEEISLLLQDWGIIHETSKRSILKGFELDIYVPKINVAIEYNGIYWHSDAVKKDKNIHYNKWSMCLDKNIHLVQIWEDDWYSKQKAVIAKLKDTFGIGKNPLTTMTVPLKEKEAKIFLNKYSLGAIPKDSYYYGIVDNVNNIQAVTSFTLTNSNTVLIHSYVSKEYIADGVESIIVAIEERYPSKTITILLDNLYENRSSYEKIGFTVQEDIALDYMLVYKNKRISKQDKASSNNSLSKIWDAGKTLMRKTL